MYINTSSSKNNTIDMSVINKVLS